MELEVIEDMEKQHRNLENGYEKLVDICISYREVETEIFHESDLLRFEPEVNDIIEYMSQLNSYREDIENLTDVIVEINETIDTIGGVVGMALLEEEANTLLKMTLELTTQNGLIRKLDSLIKTTETVEAMEFSKRDNVENLEWKFDSEFPDVCPLCGKVK
jgi:hypothetical protein